LDAHRGTLGDESEREVLYEQCWNDLPGRLWSPRLTEIIKRYWFRPLWRNVLKSEGWAFLGGAQGERVARLRAVTYDECRAHVLELLHGAAADIAAARRYLEEFAEAWPELDIDVEATMLELRMAAGL
jgi:hypothetical protein